jgi:hypothetical protein
LVTKDVDTGKIKQYHDSSEFPSDGTVLEGLQVLSDADHIVFHNYIGYDRKVIKKLYPNWTEPKSFDDTFILSQILYANVVQSHSIAEWGRIFGQAKPGHEDWSRLSEDMLHRCREDTHIGYTLYLRCQKSREKYGIEDAIRLEYKVYGIDSEYEHWYINEKRLKHFIHRLTTIKELLRKRVIKTAPHQPQHGSTFKTLFKKNGELLLNVVKYAEKHSMDLDTIQGPFSKVEFFELNPSSSVQVSAWLMGLGWQPELFNYKKGPNGRPLKDDNGNLIVSTPKFGGEFKGIPEDLRDLLKKFNKCSKRLGTLEGYDKSQTNGHMPRSAFTCGTNTARYRHRGIVNVPKADKDIYLGRMMRSLFTVPAGYSLVGCDASQLELTIEAHYVYDFDGGIYAKALMEENQHDKTARDLKISRAKAKEVNFALPYGCQSKKLASILECDEPTAKVKWDEYWESRPGTLNLKERLESSVEARGYSRRESLWGSRAFIRTIDNRPIFVRSWHSLVNSLIQSAGMIVMKVALCYAHKYLKDKKIPGRLAILYHDEMNWIVKEGHEQEVLEICQKSIRKAAEYFDLKVPLKSAGGIGKTWKDVH